MCVNSLGLSQPANTCSSGIGVAVFWASEQETVTLKVSRNNAYIFIY